MIQKWGCIWKINIKLSRYLQLGAQEYIVMVSYKKLINNQVLFNCFTFCIFNILILLTWLPYLLHTFLYILLMSRTSFAYPTHIALEMVLFLSLSQNKSSFSTYSHELTLLKWQSKQALASQQRRIGRWKLETWQVKFTNIHNSRK